MTDSFALGNANLVKLAIVLSENLTALPPDDKKAASAKAKSKLVLINFG